MLSCQHLTEIVTDYAEGRMGFWERVRLQFHLGMCRNCRAYMRQAKQTVEVLGRLPDEPLPEGLEDELAARFAAMAPKTKV